MFRLIEKINSLREKDFQGIRNKYNYKRLDLNSFMEIFIRTCHLECIDVKFSKYIDKADSSLVFSLEISDNNATIIISINDEINEDLVKHFEDESCKIMYGVTALLYKEYQSYHNIIHTLRLLIPPYSYDLIKENMSEYITLNGDTCRLSGKLKIDQLLDIIKIANPESYDIAVRITEMEDLL